MPESQRMYVPWIRNWRLVPSPFEPAQVLPVRYGFRTLGRPGCLSADREEAAWHLDLQIGQRATSIRLSPHGLLVTAEGPEVPPLLSVCVPEAGLLVGDADPSLRPTLASEALEVVRDGEEEYIQVDDALVALRVIRRAGRLRFTVLLDAARPDDLRAAARRHLDTDPAAWQAEKLARFDLFWLRHAELETEPAGLLACSIGGLIANLRPAAGSLSFPWSASPVEAAPCLAARELYPLVCAWADVDPNVPANLVKSMLAHQREDGALPASVRPDGQHDFSHAPLPLVARSALRAWRAAPNRDFFDYALPRLHRYVSWALRHFDPEDLAQPRWQDAEEALVTSAFDADLVSVDLVSMLVSEIDALEDMSRSAAAGGPALDDLAAYRTRLLECLRRSLWDEAAQSFRDRYLQGEPIARIMLSAVLPLLTRHLNRDFAAPLCAHVGAPDKFLTARGLRAWVPWEGDATAPPVLATQQMLVMDGLLLHGDASTAERVRRALLETALDDFAVTQSLDPAADDTDAGPESAAVTCALAVTLLAKPSDGLLQAPELSPLLTWMDRHRVAVLAVVCAAFALAFGSIMISSCSKRALTLQALETTAGLARRHYTEGHYDEALRLYQDIADSGRTFPGFYVALGNVHFRMGALEEAERSYRREIEKNAQSPQAVMNLALTLHEARRTGEAIACWRQVTNDFAVLSPALAARAATALELVEGAR